MHLQIACDAALDLLQKGAELDAAMTRLAAPDHRSGFHVEGGKQVERAMPAIVVRHALGPARPEGKGCSRTLHRLDLRLLVDAQHQRAIGWSEVEADDVAHLFDERGIRGELESVGLVRPQTEGAPDA